MRWRARAIPAVQETAATGAALGRIQKVVFVGGHGVELSRLHRYDVTFFENVVAFASADAEPVLIGYDQLTSITATGPGAVTTSPGMVGGGIGADAAIGMGVAGAVNALFTETTIQTVLHFQGPKLDVFVVTDAATPQRLQIELSPIRQRLSAPREHAGSDDGLAAQLERLGALRDRGVLSAAEFEAAKAKVLGLDSPAV